MFSEITFYQIVLHPYFLTESSSFYKDDIISYSVGESGHTPDTFSLDVICSATIQVRRTTNTVAVGLMRGLHDNRKTSELT